MRGCAVLSVLVFHYLWFTQVLRTTPGLSGLHQLGSFLHCGVDIFFVLSGFLIGGSLMASRGRPDYFSRYFTSRIARIFPLYYLWLGLFFLISALPLGTMGGAIPWLLDSGGVPLWSYLLFVQNFPVSVHGVWGPSWLAVTWTLAIEMQFYLLAAIVIRITPARFVGLAALVFIAIAMAFKQWGGPYFGGHALMSMTIARLDSPFMGVLCAWLWRLDPVRDLICRRGNALAAAASVLMVGYYLTVAYDVVAYPVSVLSLNAVVFGVGTLAFAGPALATPGAVVRGLRWCGVRCYAIYLIHEGILGLVSGVIYAWPPNVWPPGVGWPAVIVAAVITFSLAALSWRYFEKPCIDAAGALAARERGAVMTTA